jgi:hypothetical protein
MAATLKLIETTIAEKTVRMRLADHQDKQQAREWIEFQVDPSYVVAGRNLFDQTDDLFLAEARLAALRRAQTAIGDEIHRLARLADQLRN